MGLFLALLLGFLHHIVPADTPGGIMSAVMPAAPVVAMTTQTRQS